MTDCRYPCPCGDPIEEPHCACGCINAPPAVNEEGGAA